MSMVAGMPDILVHSRLNRAHNDTKIAWQNAQQEAVTGEAADPYKATGGDPTRLMAIERSVATLDNRAPLLSMAKSRAGATQQALDTVHAATEGMGVELLQDVEGLEISVARSTAKEAESTLSHVLSALNTELSGRHLFGGARAGAPMPGIDAVMNDMKDIVDYSTAYQAAVDVAQADPADDGVLDADTRTLHQRVVDNIDAYFTAGETVDIGPAIPPTGINFRSFDARFADGDDPADPPPVELADGEHLDYAIRGDATELREMMKGLATAAVAIDAYDAPADSDRLFALLEEAGKTMIAATDGLVKMRSDLGLSQSRIEEAQTRNAAERTTLEIARADLIGVDQYEAATRVTELENQLQKIYALTARSSRLSLLNYL